MVASVRDSDCCIGNSIRAILLVGVGNRRLAEWKSRLAAFNCAVRVSPLMSNTDGRKVEALQVEVSLRSSRLCFFRIDSGRSPVSVRVVPMSQLR